MIPDSVIEEIRGRVDAVAVMNRHMELNKSGQTWKGCCIFHNERSPSFHVYPDGHYKCYGCGERGDVFKFLQKVQGKEFPEVVRALAAEVGITIPEEDLDGPQAEQLRQLRREKNEIIAVNDAAARYWAARLWSQFGEGGQKYLAERGVSEEMAKRFRLGIAAPGWSDLGSRLVQKGFGDAALRRAGLLVDKNDSSYDRFRGRLMFPIAASGGEVIAFGGRAMGDEKGAKYINSPETLLYKKSKVLYGLDLARESIRKLRAAILVEGYFDVISLHQVGIDNAVAVCGTALTAEHVELLKRCDCREVTVLFDGDSAGIAAPGKAAQVLLPSGITGKVAILPRDAGKVDPDEFARREGRTGIERVLAGAVPLSQFLIEQAIQRHCGDRVITEVPLEQKLAVVAELKPFLLAVGDGLPRSVFEERIAQRLQIDLAALHQDLEPRAPAEQRPRSAPPARAGFSRGGLRSVGGGQNRHHVIMLASPAVDALGLLAAFPKLAAAADEEGLPGLFPDGALADLARDLIADAMPIEQVVARLEGAADAISIKRVRELIGPGRPKDEDAERELRRATLKAKIHLIRAEQDSLLAQLSKGGSFMGEELAPQQLDLVNRRRDLERRLRKLE